MRYNVAQLLHVLGRDSCCIRYLQIERSWSGFYIHVDCRCSACMPLGSPDWIQRAAMRHVIT